MNLTGKPLIRLRHHTQVLATSVRHNTTMATTSSTQSAAPWRSQFLEHVGKMESPEFVLSTVARPHNSSFSAEPRARYCIFRGMWASLPPNKHNDADKNPEVYESDCLTFTTDVRMEKANHFFESESSDETATGGGAPVEAVWWVKEKDIMTQWRVRGDAWILGPDVEDGRKKGPKTVKEAIQPRMRVLNETQKDDWKWGTEVTAHFGNLSPGMRGSFKNPPPGRPVKHTEDPGNKLIGELLDDHYDPVAHENFRVVIIRPFRVEATDLSNPRKARRREYIFDKESAQWQHEILWP